MGKATILIVEDEAIVATDLAGKLRRLGYEVVGTTAQGEEAIVLPCRLRPDLVLMDISLEGSVDGIAAAEAIRRQQNVPVVFLTAHSDPTTLARANLTDPFGYISSPSMSATSQHRSSWPSTGTRSTGNSTRAG